MASQIFVMAILTAVSFPVKQSTAETPVIPEVRIGALKVSGQNLKVNYLENAQHNSAVGVLECSLLGEAKLILGAEDDVELSLSARQMKVRYDGKSALIVTCQGECRLEDSTYFCQADNMELHLENTARVVLKGHAVVEFREGGQRLSSEEIQYHDGKFQLQGPATLEPAE